MNSVPLGPRTPKPNGTASGPGRGRRTPRLLRPHTRVRTLGVMSEPIVSIDTSQIREGKLDDLKEAVVELVAFVESNEDRPIVYDIFFDQSGTLMTVVQVHPDSESMEHHMTVAGPAFAGFSELVTLSTLDVYGEPSEALLEQLRRKVQLLGPATVLVHDLQAGFARLDPR